MGDDSDNGPFRTYPYITDSIDQCFEVIDQRAATRGERAPDNRKRNAARAMVENFPQKRKIQHLGEILNVGSKDSDPHHSTQIIPSSEMLHNATSLILRHYETLKRIYESTPSLEFDASKRPEEAIGARKLLRVLYRLKIGGVSSQDLETHLDKKGRWSDPYQRAWILVHILGEPHRSFRAAGNFAQIAVAHFNNLYDHGILEKAFPDIAKKYTKQPAKKPEPAVA